MLLFLYRTDLRSLADPFADLADLRVSSFALQFGLQLQATCVK